MKAIYDQRHQLHHPRNFLVAGTLRPSPEVPERASVLLSAAQAGGHEIVVPDDLGPGPRSLIHSAEYLQFLEHIAERWGRIDGAADEVMPNVHPGRPAGGYPASPIGQAGYHMADTACPISPGTWEAACAAANAAAHGAQLLVDGELSAYVLCRPPGHHAFGDMAGGFCFLNNAAIAAQQLRERWDRVAILDVDVHHGNGTQSIFYDRADVLTVSLHGDPSGFYPFFWGYAHERGQGRGEGCNLNLPLPRGTGDDDFLDALETAFRRIGAFAPGALVVALGLDAYEGDPLAWLAITTAGFGAIGQAIGSLGLPTLLVQEGGYPAPALGDNLASFLAGFETGQEDL